MAVGDIVQFSAAVELGTDTVLVSSSVGQPTTWDTPTSGNTLVVYAMGRSDAISISPSGFTSVFDDNETAVDDEYVRVYSKVSAGSETTITVTFSNASEDHGIAAYEIEGEVTFDVGSAGFSVTDGTSKSSGSTGTLAGTDSIALAMCWHFIASDTAFSDSYVLDANYEDGVNGDLYYMGIAHKVLAGTTATETTGSWTGSTDGWTAVVVFTIMNLVLESILYPIADTAATGWDTAPTASQSLYVQIDEVTASDTDYIFTEDPNA